MYPSIFEILFIILFYFSLCYIKLLHSGSICGRLLSLVSCIIYYTTCSQPVLALASVQHRIKKAKKIPKAKKKSQKTTLYPIPHDCVPTFPINPTLTLLLNLYVSIILDYYYNFIMITIFLYFIDYYFIASSKPIYI